MPEDPKPEPAETVKPDPPPDEGEKESEAGDFITRHVLEKDSVFFEG